MINIIDLVGNSDTNGKPIGHPIKVIKQFQELLYDETINIILPSNYKGYVSADKYFRFFKRSMRRDLFSKVFNAVYKLLMYFRYTYFCKDNILFVNTDIYLLLAASLIMKNKKVKTFAVVYMDYMKSGSFLKKWIIKRAYRNIDFIITNEYSASLINSKQILLPDYFYSKDYYFMEKKEFKYDFLICGLIFQSKNVEDVLESVHKRNGEFKVKVCGLFEDEKRFVQLKEKYKGIDFISIENEYVDEEKYKQLFAETRYLVLPYIHYADRGSGVFYDAIYFNTPVIATEIKIFEVIRRYKMGFLYKSSFGECLEDLNGETYNTFIGNIKLFCEEHSIEKYREEFRKYLN